MLLYSPRNTWNYYAPLSSQANEIENIKTRIKNVCTQPSTGQIQVTFSLPNTHIGKNNANWRQKMAGTTKVCAWGVLDGNITSTISNIGVMTNTFTPLDPTIVIGIKFTAMFGGTFGSQDAAMTVNNPHLKIHEPARSVHIVPQVWHSLLSASKMVDAIT